MAYEYESLMRQVAETEAAYLEVSVITCAVDVITKSLARSGTWYEYMCIHVIDSMK